MTMRCGAYVGGVCGVKYPQVRQEDCEGHQGTMQQSC